MEGRKWEDLPRDCLVDVLGRVGVESLLFHIPFVCKSWYQAILNPLCWKHLHFPALSPYMCLKYGLQGENCSMKLVKRVVDWSAGCATYVKLTIGYGAQELSYVADKCPSLKTLVLHSRMVYKCNLSTLQTLSSVTCKFKNLEVLCIRTGFLFKDIVTQVGVHCQNFTTLILDTEGKISNASIGEDEVMTIVSCLPKLKSLTLKEVTIERENLIKLLNGCVALVHLDVRGCCGFDEDDEQLLKLASHIPTFESLGSGVSKYDYKFYDYDSDNQFDIESYYDYDDRC